MKSFKRESIQIESKFHDQIILNELLILQKYPILYQMTGH